MFRKRFLFLCLVFIMSLLVLTESFVPRQTIQAQDQPLEAEPANWYTAGGNMRRTSWVAEEVNPNDYENYGVTWYRPIEAYIGQHVQIVTGYGNIYIASARGLYALDAQTGNTVWRFDTQLPLGHSPTVINNTVYVGGFDRRVYALNAQTGAVKWTFTNAGDGFSTNPLVVNGLVLLGNLDGYFYALDETDGSLRWRYPSAGQDPLAPISYSAAYADGVIYFAALNNMAYALNASNGSLVWQAGPLSGEGFQAWWPVIYRDMVIFSGAEAYRQGETIGTGSITAMIPDGSGYSINPDAQVDLIYGIQSEEIMYPNNTSEALIGSTLVTGSSNDTVGINWAWPNGSKVIDGSRLTQFLEDDGQVRFDRAQQKPWRRLTIALKRNNGSPYAFDSDGDGYMESLPFVPVGTKSGNQYPPIVMPDKDGNVEQVLYRKNMYQYRPGWGIDDAAVMGWTPEAGKYLQWVEGDRFAIDEPLALSGGGNIIYKNLCCDRVATWVDLASDDNGMLWNYQKTLESLQQLLDERPWDLQSWYISYAPTYDEKWYGSSIWDPYPRLYGGFGGVNAAYHNAGHQNPIIPYQGMLFVQRSNAIIAFGPNPPRVPDNAKLPPNPTPADHEAYEAAVIALKKRPLLTIDTPDYNGQSLTETQLRNRLETEIEKMLAAGHLRPGYYTVGQHGYSELADYFDNPGDTLLTLALAYPYLSADLQGPVRTYMQAEFQRYFADGWIADIGWRSETGNATFGDLAAREYAPIPPEVAAHMATTTMSNYAHFNAPWYYPQYNFYALWKYAEIFPNQALPIYQRIVADKKFQLLWAGTGEKTMPTDQELQDNPWEQNAYIAASIGFLGLQSLAGREQADASLRQQVQSALTTQLANRVAWFEKDQPWTDDRVAQEGGLSVLKRDMAVARNFLFMTPELGSYLRLHAQIQMAAAIAEYEAAAPYWFVSRYEASLSEGIQRHLYDSPAIFQAKAYVLHESREQLSKYISAPAFAVGDLFYIQNLVAALSTYSEVSLTEHLFLPTVPH